VIVTPYGDIELGDREAMRQWMAAHDIRHRTYSVALLRKGIVSQSPPLMDQLNHNWLMMHYIQHVILAKQFAPDTTAQSHGLNHDFMESDKQFQNWHRTHNLVHQRLDQAFGVVNRG
jgi:hypothetical protein